MNIKTGLILISTLIFIRINAEQLNPNSNEMERRLELHKEKKKQKEDEKYELLFQRGENYRKAGSAEAGIRIFAYLYRTGHLPPDRNDEILMLLADYFFQKSLDGIAIGFYEEHLKDGKYFTDDFFVNMGKSYVNLGKYNKAKRFYETVLISHKQSDDLVNKELQALDKISSVLKNKKGMLEVTLVHPGQPYILADPMILKVKLQNIGVQKIKIDSMFNDGVARNIAVAVVRDWSRVVTSSDRNIIAPGFTHPGLESSENYKKFVPIDKKTFIELSPGDSYEMKINLWKYLDFYVDDILKQEEPVLEEFREYFVCVCYSNFFVEANNNLGLYPDQSYSNAILVTINKKKKQWE